MQAVEKERFFTSLFSAVILHMVIVVLLGFVDLQPDRSLQQTIGPVAVRLQIPPPRFLPEPPPESEIEPSSGEVPRISQASEIPRQQLDNSSAAGKPAGETPGLQSQTTPSSVPAAGADSAAVSMPSWLQQPKGEYSGVESGPSVERRANTARESPEPPASRSSDAPKYGDPVPEESEVIYADSPSPSETAPAGIPSDGKTVSQERVISSELSREVAGITAAGTRNGANAADEPRNGESGGTRTDSSDVSTGSPGSAPFQIEGIQNRELLDFEMPVLTDREKSLLPGSLEIAVEFKLMPNGDVSPSVYLTQGTSTGHPEIDIKFVKAVRSWRFDSLPAGKTEEVTGIVRFRIRAR